MCIYLIHVYIFVYMWGAWDIARVTALSGIASFLTTRWFRWALETTSRVRHEYTDHDQSQCHT